MAKTIKLTKEKPKADPELVKGLNDNQKAAVEATGGPLLIIAGAGSGKTRVLTHRIAHIIDLGTEPFKILALTFTNKAAGELKNRIAKIVGHEKANMVWAGTFHSIFARILRIEAKRLNYSSGFSIYDTDDQASAIRAVLQRLRLNVQEYPVNQVRSLISGAKNKMIDYEKFSDEARSHFEKTVGMIYKEYESYLFENNAMDFDDLLLNMIRLFELDKEALNKYRDKFKYILIDEYQDTNKAQYKIIKLLTGAHNNICVVGDDAQSIYRWRGADIRNILEFQKDFPAARVVKLEQNYRSTSNILAAADSVIANNKNQLKKVLISNKGEGEKVLVINCEDDRQEALKISELVREKVAKGNAYKDFAVLYRTNAQSLPLENAMRKADIPYQIIGGISFYKRKEIKDVMAYLRLLVNKSDDVSLLRIVNEPPRGIGKTSMSHFSNFATKGRIPLLETFQISDQVTTVVARAKKSAANLASIIAEYSEMIEAENPINAIRDYIQAVGILDMYKEIGTDEALDKFNNIQEVINDISTFFQRNSDASLNDYLQQISLSSDVDNADFGGNTVSLMTLHSAKGLEFPVVFMAGLEAGLFPSQRTEGDPEELEEERRLFYVGATRAMDELIITYCDRRMKFGEIQRQGVSMFLKELDHSSSRWIGGSRPVNQARTTLSGTPISTGSNILGSWRSKVTQSAPKKTMDEIRRASGSTSNMTEMLRPGDRVTHSKFGEGKLIEISGSGDQQKVTVNFDNHGKKNMISKFARLTKI
ncbi:MAG: UvrD-helicase domain-containing protein [Candidatus Kapaibacteriales bacterium]